MPVLATSAESKRRAFLIGHAQSHKQTENYRTVAIRSFRPPVAQKFPVWPSPFRSERRVPSTVFRRDLLYSLVAAGVGSNSHPVDSQFRQFRDTHADRDAKYLPVDVPEFLLVLATKVADRAVIDGAARDQPHEIDRVFDLIFHDSRTAYAADHGEQQNLAQDARVNRRLADSSSVPTFPCGPVEPVENPIAQPVGMIVRNPFFEADWDQKYLNSLARWRLPVAFVERFLRH